MARWDTYTYGLQQVADDVWAFLQPDGSWGWNNTALLGTPTESLLVDATIDIRTTQKMLAQMAAACPAAESIDYVVLTHWHVDHVHGISAPELSNSTVVASKVCAEYMAKMPPAVWLASIAQLDGNAKKQMDRQLDGQFDFSGLRYVPPGRTFEGRLDLAVGGREVAIIEARPCHTRSDSIIHIPHAGVVHMGDLVRAKHHVGLQFPFMANLIDICETAYRLDADLYIPGHGPLMERSDLKIVIDYLRFLKLAAQRRYDAGMLLSEAFDDLLKNLGEYADYTGAQGLYFTMKMLYAELAGDSDDHVRRDYPTYLATQWRLHNTLPCQHPQLFLR